MSNDNLTPIPQDIMIKDEFKKHYKELLKEKYDVFMKYSLSYINKSIRVNTIKISVNNLKVRLKKNWFLKKIPWTNYGFFIEFKEKKRFDIGNLIEHQLGYFYIQDAASMIPPIVLNPEPGSKVLDLCAAPGSKTTQLAQIMNNKGLIVANDIDFNRLKPLGLNLQRCGVANTVISYKGNKRFQKESFDYILVDAPCSGTGTIRKSLKVLQMWSPGLVKRMSRIQKKLILEAFDLLKKNGVLVYSTCTLEPEENEEVIDFLLKNRNCKIEDINLNINRSEAILEWQGKSYDGNVRKVLRIYPQDNNTEGFFIARIRKM